MTTAPEQLDGWLKGMRTLLAAGSPRDLDDAFANCIEALASLLSAAPAPSAPTCTGCSYMTAVTTQRERAEAAEREVERTARDRNEAQAAVAALLKLASAHVKERDEARRAALLANVVDAWAWMPGGENDLATMGEEMAVTMAARALRELLAQAARDAVTASWERAKIPGTWEQLALEGGTAMHAGESTSYDGGKTWAHDKAGFTTPGVRADRRCDCCNVPNERLGAFGATLLCLPCTRVRATDAEHEVDRLTRELSAARRHAGAGELNINADVWVRLTERGHKLLSQHGAPRTTEQGWTRVQFWELMSALGSKLYMGGPLLIEGGNVRLSDPLAIERGEMVGYDKAGTLVRAPKPKPGGAI